MRTFEKHIVRDVRSLDGLWDFRFSEQSGDNGAFSTRIAVPGCWDATVDFANRRGIGTYGRKFTISEDGTYRLCFEGVANEAIISIDGEEVFRHYGSHTAFATPNISLAEGSHEVFVQADNRFGEHNTLLQKNCGWYCYGGIHRSVYLEKVAEARIDHLRIRTLSVDGKNAEIEIRARLSNQSQTSIARTLHVAIDELWRDKVSVKLAAGESWEYEKTIRFNDITPWSPEQPQLYNIAAECEDDDLRDRFGIRTVNCGKQQVLLNGQALKLRGINHHDYHPESGYTSDLLRIKKDLALIKSMGLNFVRTSHYPKDQLFLDLCDEMGLMVLEEATGWQNGPDEMRRPLYLEQCLQCIDEMVTEHFNHPSVIIWGLLNEVRSEYDDLRGVFESLIGRFKTLDPSRPVTFATNRLLDNRDKMLDLVDILCPNIYNRWYYGEYGDEYPADPAGYFEELLRWFDEANLSDKPILIGEFGAGAVPGNRRFDRRRWSEEFQADALAEALDVYDNHPRISGYAIWLFADTACSENEEMGRPGSHNCKGLVDEYRRPKIAFYDVKKRLNP